MLRLALIFALVICAFSDKTLEVDSLQENLSAGIRSLIKFKLEHVLDFENQWNPRSLQGSRILAGLRFHNSHLHLSHQYQLPPIRAWSNWNPGETGVEGEGKETLIELTRLFGECHSLYYVKFVSVVF